MRWTEGHLAAPAGLRGRGGGDLAGVGARGMRAGGFPGNPGGLVVSIVKTAGGRAPAHQARGRGRSTWRPTERSRRCSDGTAGRRQRSAGGWTARSRRVSGDGRGSSRCSVHAPPGISGTCRQAGAGVRLACHVSQSTAEAGELSPRDPVEGRGHRQVAPVEGKTANTPRLGPVSTSRQPDSRTGQTTPWGWRWPSPGFLDPRVRDGA